jgi:hypothetical protein
MNFEQYNFGDWNIPKELFNHITNILPKGKTILELGSGKATQEFSHYGYKMFSVEHNPFWLNRYYTNYIYAPLVNNWYDLSNLNKILKSEYDLLLIDGPDSNYRFLFLNYLDNFNLNIPIVLDNCDYPTVNYLARELSFVLNRPIKKITDKCCEI